MNSGMPITGELRNWRKQVCRDGRYVYWGNIYGDMRDRFPDGYFVHTSAIVHEDENLVITKNGNAYRLVGESDGPPIYPASK